MVYLGLKGYLPIATAVAEKMALHPGLLLMKFSVRTR